MATSIDRDNWPRPLPRRAPPATAHSCPLAPVRTTTATTTASCCARKRRTPRRCRRTLRQWIVDRTARRCMRAVAKQRRRRRRQRRLPVRIGPTSIRFARSSSRSISPERMAAGRAPQPRRVCISAIRSSIAATTKSCWPARMPSTRYRKCGRPRCRRCHGRRHRWPQRQRQQ